MFLADKKRREEKKEKKAKDGEIPLDDVPKAARQAADEAVPKATWDAAYEDREDGELIYELAGKDAEDREVAVMVTEEGKVELIELEIALKDVPAVVTDALKAKFPRFTASTVFELKQAGKVVGYDFEGKRPKDKKEIGISVSVDGKEVEKDEG